MRPFDLETGRHSSASINDVFFIGGGFEDETASRIDIINNTQIPYFGDY